ncbi:MAG: hypothetical protein ABIY50_05755 [Ignavibacteria bacterium]
MREKSFTINLDTIGAERLRIIFKTDKGVVKDLVVQYECLVAGTWEEILRYDCSHGYFHRDVMKKDGSKRKRIIHVFDLNEALTLAETDLKVNWESYKQNYFEN